MWTRIGKPVDQGGNQIQSGPGGEYEMLGMLAFLQQCRTGTGPARSSAGSGR